MWLTAERTYLIGEEMWKHMDSAAVQGWVTDKERILNCDEVGGVTLSSPLKQQVNDDEKHMVAMAKPPSTVSTTHRFCTLNVVMNYNRIVHCQVILRSSEGISAADQTYQVFYLERYTLIFKRT